MTTPVLQAIAVRHDLLGANIQKRVDRKKFGLGGTLSQAGAWLMVVDDGRSERHVKAWAMTFGGAPECSAAGPPESGRNARARRSAGQLHKSHITISNEEHWKMEGFRVSLESI